MTHLRRHGKQIREEVTFISRDDAHYLDSTRPIVARYPTNSAGLARRVAKAARQLAETGTLSTKAVSLMPEFVQGEGLGDRIQNRGFRIWEETNGREWGEEIMNYE